MCQRYRLVSFVLLCLLASCAQSLAQPHRQWEFLPPSYSEPYIPTRGEWQLMMLNQELGDGVMCTPGVVVIASAAGSKPDHLSVFIAGQAVSRENGFPGPEADALFKSLLGGVEWCVNKYFPELAPTGDDGLPHLGRLVQVDMMDWDGPRATWKDGVLTITPRP